MGSPAYRLSAGHFPASSMPAPRPRAQRPAAASARTGGDEGHGGGQGGGGGGGGGSGGGTSSGGGGGGRHLPLVAVLSVAASDLLEARHVAVQRQQQQAGSGGGRWLLGMSFAALGTAALLAGAESRQQQQEVQQEAAAATSIGAVGKVASPETPPQQPPATPAPSSTAEQPAPQPRRIVLFVEPSPFTYMSGYQTRFLATIREMVEAGCEVLVVTPGRGAAGLLPGGAPQPAEFAGARVVEAGSFPCPGYGSVPLSLGLSPRIFGEVRRWRPDVIHVTSPGALPFAAFLYSRMLRVPLVASFHTNVPNYLPKLGLQWLAGGVWGLIRFIHRSAHLTIAVSPTTATELVGAGACDHQAVKVWPKAVDTEAFHPRHASPDMRLRLAGCSAISSGGGQGAPASAGADAPLLLYVGRVSLEKNLHLLRPVLERLPGMRLAIVGDGPAMATLKAHFEGMPTVFLGALRGCELAAAYASADVFVMPSESETLGNVVGEAMASGLPVVAAAAGGVPSVIGRPGETGILFPPGDANAAAAAIRRLMADPRARRDMGRAARAEMAGKSWRHATREILTRFYPAAMAARSRQQQQGVQGQWAGNLLA